MAFKVIVSPNVALRYDVSLAVQPVLPGVQRMVVELGRMTLIPENWYATSGEEIPTMSMIAVRLFSTVGSERLMVGVDHLSSDP